MKNPKKFSKLISDQDAINEVDTIDLSEYDLSGFKPVNFKYQKKSARLELRISEEQLAAWENLAKK